MPDPTVVLDRQRSCCMMFRLSVGSTLGLSHAAAGGLHVSGAERGQATTRFRQAPPRVTAEHVMPAGAVFYCDPAPSRRRRKDAAS